jgi:hypothetical protein
LLGFNRCRSQDVVVTRSSISSASKERLMDPSSLSACS